MSYQIADAIVEVKVDGDGEEKKKEIAAEFRTKPQWQLMPDEWRKKLGNLEGRARSLLSHASVQFAARGMCVLPVTRAQEIFAGLRALRAEMHQYRDEFVAEYETILENLESTLDKDLFKKVQGKLPDSAIISEKFSMVWAIIPAGGRSAVTDTELELLEAALTIAERPELTKAQRQRIERGQQVLAALRGRLEQETRQIADDEAADLIEEARAQMHTFTQELVENMCNEPRRMLMEAADNLLEALRDPERIIRNGTLDQVRRAIAMVEGFEFLAGPELLATMRACQERLDSVDARTLNSDVELGARLAAGLQVVRDHAADVAVASTAMRQFRGIRLRAQAQEEAAESAESDEDVAAATPVTV